MCETGCDPFVASFYLDWEADYDAALTQYRDDEAWGKLHEGGEGPPSKGAAGAAARLAARGGGGGGCAVS